MLFLIGLIISSVPLRDMYGVVGYITGYPVRVGEWWWGLLQPGPDRGAQHSVRGEDHLPGEAHQLLATYLHFRGWQKIVSILKNITINSPARAACEKQGAGMPQLGLSQVPSSARLINYLKRCGRSRTRCCSAISKGGI